MQPETFVRTATRRRPRWNALACAALVAGCASSEGVAGNDDPDANVSGPVDAGVGGETDAAPGTPGHDAAMDGGGGVGPGFCCPSGDCLCHGPDPTGLTSSSGPFATDRFTISTGTVHYPTNAEPPFAAVAICGGYTNTGPEMAPWAAFYASHGIVTITVATGAADQPGTRSAKLLAAIVELEAENADPTSPLFGDLSGRYGTSGYSLGGGATTLASASDPTLRTSVGLAAHSGVGTGVQVPTLLLCGQSDTTAPCSMSQQDYGQIPATTPKMLLSIPGASHFSWFGPTNAGGGMSGKYALAFQKVFLEGDERWRPFLLTAPGGAAVQTTNIVE
jgi:pimeloyl-ACP methyl ester carboxylesterase